MPGRAWLREAVTRATRHARRSVPLRTGRRGRELGWHADAGDDKLRLVMRRTAGAPLEPVLDPGTWASDEALAFAVPSPDDARVAFGKAVGGTHDAVIHVLDVDRGELLPDRPRGTAHTAPAWRPDRSGFFYAACPDPGEVPAGDEPHWNAIYEHRLGSGAPARRIFGDDQHNEHWCSVEVSECGRFAILTRWDYVHANVVYLLRLADDVLVPVAPEMRSLNQVQVIGDADRPRRRRAELLLLGARRRAAATAAVAYPHTMRDGLPLDLDDGDDVGFVHAVRGIVGGAVHLASPAEIYVVKIDSWFSQRWLGFSHKLLGRVGVAYRITLRIPPFVPNRVVAERYLARTRSGYGPAAAPQALHIAQTGTDNDRRLVSRLCPRAALFWWSGATRRHGRGALMAYLPAPDGHAAWYAELASAGDWSPSRTVGTSPVELAGLAHARPAA